MFFLNFSSTLLLLMLVKLGWSKILTTRSTLSTLILQNSKCGVNFILPSTKFIQCQTVIINALKSSPNPDVNLLWAATSNGTNIQYDQYKNTKQVLTAIRKDHEDRINHELTSQGFIMSSILKLSNLKFVVFGQLCNKICLKYLQLHDQVSK